MPSIFPFRELETKISIPCLETAGFASYPGDVLAYTFPVRSAMSDSDVLSKQNI